MLIMEKYFRLQAREFLKLFQLEELHTVAMIARVYYLFLRILKSNNQLISLDMEEFIITNSLKFLVVTIIAF